jgi:hypothetical protein
VAYANTVKKNGFFIGLLDLALLARSRKKRLMVLHYHDACQDPPQLAPVMDIFHPLYASSEHSPPEDIMHVDHESGTWNVAVLLADYTRGSYQQLNHFVPLFQKDTMGEQLWSKLTQESSIKHAKRIQKCQAMLPGEDESDDEFAASAREHLELLLRQQDFNQITQGIDLFASAVPGAGNCGLWTMLSLEGGPIAKCQGVDQKAVQQMREDTWYSLIIFSICFICIHMFPYVFPTKRHSIPFYPYIMTSGKIFQGTG